jgi:hypothetical protein
MSCSVRLRYNTARFISSVTSTVRSETSCANCLHRNEAKHRVHDAFARKRDLSVRCNTSSSVDAAPVSKARIAAYILLWYLFNIVFNIVNKLTLNAIPMPWLIGTWQLAASSMFMCILWATKLHKRPVLPRGFWKALLPVAFFHTIGHMSACLCFSKMAVSFVHVIKVCHFSSFKHVYSTKEAIREV